MVDFRQEETTRRDSWELRGEDQLEQKELSFIGSPLGTFELGLDSKSGESESMELQSSVELGWVFAVPNLINKFQQTAVRTDRDASLLYSP